MNARTGEIYKTRDAGLVMVKGIFLDQINVKSLISGIEYATWGDGFVFYKGDTPCHLDLMELLTSPFVLPIKYFA